MCKLSEPMLNLEQTPAWKQLQQHQCEQSNFSLTQAFTDNPARARMLSIEAAGLFYDFSKQLINEQSIENLLALAEQQNLSSAITELRQGEKVNTTEGRAALHHLLRAQTAPTDNVFLEECFTKISTVKARMKNCSEAILNGQISASNGKPFTDVVNIGIGGSDLGCTMIYQALKPFQKKNIRCHYVSNISAYDLQNTLEIINPEQTLFIIASKTFSTLETLKNADAAKKWLAQYVPQKDIGKHFFAVTSATDKALAYGIEEDAIYPLWDWVGGRYSTYSAIGLSLAIGLGFENFERLLAGAAEMDQHFFNAPLKENMPVIMALVGIWNTNFWNKSTLCIAPYDARLRRFPAFLQQLEMESTGKSASKDNQKINYATCPSIFGEAGSNSQHSFFQHLHQGTDFTPVDFIVAAQGIETYNEHQDWLMANCLAQSQALMSGFTSAESGFEQHKSMSGNRPSSTIMMQALTPETLGALLSLYEQKTYCQSIIWNINAFDQWGVELGKKISVKIKAAIDEPSKAGQFDTSTEQLLNRFSDQKNR